ncbi:MAG: diphthine--ammonia ligase [Bacteroidetes bacterium]|nr:diphthine--ammonia ligase [Bacteroidota bacterium]MBU1373671.1 diphthine--ammonia ligase [Bacteroidota bacterium]MBU1484066.1 diphthine--ammonia ligase [Bacteroidota bacterium]MBU1759961.1 diphthine--ammonia ligase [Bacteroidota bacterium]MBU2268438.1 diphthine--ammonia ligase [Bacteroidota bacterium]
MNKIPCIFNWSGGKDSSLALYHCLQNPTLDIKYLVTSINDSVNRVSMHGVRYALLLKQAKAIGIPLYEIRLPEMPTMSDYDETMRLHLDKLKAEGITHSIFGDIFLEDLKKYREDRLAEIGLKGIFPIWKRDSNELIQEFLGLGFKTVIACTQERLGEFLGKVIDEKLIKDLPKDVDVCGENGEFHTFAFEGPIFKNPIAYSLGEKVFKSYQAPKNADDNCFQKEEKQPKNLGFWYIDLIEE